MKPAIQCDGKICRISGITTFSQLDELSADLLLQAAREEDLQIDLAQVSQCDSAFAALLAACLQIKKQQNRHMILTGSPKKLLSLFTVYGLTDSGFQINSDLEHL